MPPWSGSLFALAVALSMDSMAVGTARGLAARDHFARDGVAVSLAFGLFQGVMPAVGWLIEDLFGRWIEAWDLWIAFTLLGLLGLKMLYEAWRGPDPGEVAQPLGFRMLLLLSLATSVDALAAGVTLPALGAPLLASVLVIGVMTSVLTGLGFALGRHLGEMAGRRLDAIGGVILIALGTKVLAEHLGWLA